MQFKMIVDMGISAVPSVQIFRSTQDLIQHIAIIADKSALVKITITAEESEEFKAGRIAGLRQVLEGPLANAPFGRPVSVDQQQANYSYNFCREEVEKAIVAAKS